MLAHTAQKGIGPRFASLQQAQRVSSPSREVAPHDKALVHALPLTSKLSASSCQVAGSHPRTRLGSTLLISPPGSVCLFAKLWTQNTGQCLGLRFASHNQAHRVSSPSRGLAPQDKAWVHVLPLSIRLRVSPRRIAGSHRRTRLRSMLCLSPPSSALLLAKSQARTAHQDSGPCYESLQQANRASSLSCELAP